jgi:hypothetical protein
MIVLLKLLVVLCVVCVLRSSEKFRTMSRELDEAALVSLKRIICATEEAGYPPEIIPLLISLSTIAFIAMMAASELFGR